MILIDRPAKIYIYKLFIYIYIRGSLTPPTCLPTQPDPIDPKQESRSVSGRFVGRELSDLIST
jgi:hypothetical protein